MTTRTKKPLTKLQEMNLHALKLKEESIGAILTTIKNNQTFAKLLIFTLNSLETFVSPPNREIKTNSNIIIRLEGVELLHIISVKNIKNDEIIELAGDIIYKLISIYDIIDKDLTKFFAEKNGHKAIIDIILKKNKNNKSILPYIKIINGLVQIPQLIPTLIENNIIEAINLDSDLVQNKDNYNGEFIQLNLNTLKQISTQKTGRDYLINKNYIIKILNNIKKSSEQKDVNSVLCGLGILENLCRNEEGRKAVKNTNCINCLSYVLTHLGHNQSILKMCAKIYSKIASPEDLKMQLELLKKCYEDNKTSGTYDNNIVDLNKSLELVSNFMLVDELGKILQEPNNFELLKNLFIQIQQINLADKDKDFLNLFISLNKNFMIIFYRLFNLDPKTLENNKDLLQHILSSVSKNWDSIKDLNDEELLKVFNSYFVFYGDIVNQDYNLIEKNREKVDSNLVDQLMYINKNILAKGQKNLDVDKNDSNPHFISCKLMKICDELSLKEDSANKINKKNEFISSLIECYPYLEFLFINKEEEEILCNSLEVIYDLANAQKDFRQNKLEQIIFKIYDFMNKKKHQRYPCLLCMKLIDIYLTPEYIKEYLRNNDPTKHPSHAINYTECIVNVMTYRADDNLDKKNNLGQTKKVEEEINALGGKLLERLIDELEFRNLVKEFCERAEAFEPGKSNKEEINKLENITKIIYGVMNVKNYYDISANAIFNSLKILLEKEIRYIEFFKRDKTNEKNPQFKNIVESTSSRMNLELLLNLRINEISQQKLNFEIYAKNLYLIFLFLSKSLDKANIKLLLNHLQVNYFFILDNENNIKLQNNENVSEKMASVDVSLLRKLIEEDDIIYSIIINLTMLAENNILLCNHMVKAGCPRLLLQIIETSPNEKNVEVALYLLKLISFSNKDNLQMVASQNALNVLYQTKNKYSSNNKIINQCVEITEEILKLPGQEKYASDLLVETIKEFNENAKKDISQNEIRQKLLNSLQLINSFVTNQSQSDLINNNEEFLENFKNVTENTFKEKELDSLNEKLLNNELSLLKKINDNKYFKYDYTVDKIIDIIKNKSKYQDILLSATDELLKNLVKQELYENYVSKKVDNSFVDSIFDDIDNYLGNIKVTKDLNNILCYLCLYNEDLANYIKQKGGLTNIIDELKLNINTFDKDNQSMKLNSMKMLYSLCKDKDGIESFLKSGGIDLLNKMIDSEIELYKDYKNNFQNDLYKTREILNFRDIKDTNEKNINKIESYIIYLIKLLNNIIDYEKNALNNNKMINNLVFLSEVKYPRKDIFVELFNLFRKSPKLLPNEEKYLFLLLKNALSLKCKYFLEKEFLEKNINNNCELILPKVNQSNNYLNNLKNSLNENKNNPLQLSYLAKYMNSIENNIEVISPIFNDIELFTLEYFNYYRNKSINNKQEEIIEGVIICLQELLCFILKSKKENSLSINDIINTLIFFGKQYLYKNGHDLFSLLFLEKCDLIFDNFENNEDKVICYKYYLDEVTPKSIEILSFVHQIILSQNDFNSLEDLLFALFELIIKNFKNFYSSEYTNICLIKFDIIFNIIIDLINDFNNIENLEEEKRIKIINDLYYILMKILSQEQLKREDFNNNIELIMKLISNMKTSKEKKYNKMENNLFQKIINSIIHNTDLNHELFDEALDFILEDIKNEPPIELEINLESLATLSKDLSSIKNLINNDELNSILLKIYNDKENLTINGRRNISTLFNNLLKNTFNVETILEKKPEIIKAILDKTVKKENIIKEENNIDIPLKELNSIISVLKDKNNSSKIIENNLIVPENISNIIDNYKGIHGSLNEALNELQNIFDILTNKKDIVENYKLDKAILDNLKEKIKEAFDEHLSELKKLSSDESNINETPNMLRATLLNANIKKNKILESTSKMNKRRLSLISQNLYYNPYNSQICSPISTKSNEDMSSTLDNLLSLIRVLYTNNKDFKDKEIQNQRISLLKEALETLKMFSICPDNHKTIEEVGLLNFMEKLDNNVDFPIYISGLDVVKNCTWSENAVLSLIENKLFDQILDEVLKFYNNPDLLSESDDNRICFFYQNILLTNISKVEKGFEAIFNKIGIEKLLKICKNTGNLDFLTSFVMVLNNYIENSKINNNEMNNPELIKDILEICKKGFNLNVENITDINENLFFKTMKLIGNIYNDISKDFIGEMDIVKIINYTFERYKDEPEYFFNSIFILKIVCLYHKLYSDEIVDLTLIDKIAKHITTKQQKDDLITNYACLLNNLLVYNEDNRIKMTNEVMINNVLFFIEKYSPRLEDLMNKIKDILSLRTSNINININKNLFNENKIMQEKDELINISNLILNNLLKALYYLSSNQKSKDFIQNYNYIDCLIHTIDKPKLHVNNLNLSFYCLSNYYYKIEKEKWKNEHIEKIYSLLKSSQQTYYTNGDILISINTLIAYIIKGLSLKQLVEKYYLLALEGINCQDWNEQLILLTLDIIKETLILHEELRNEVFENTEHTILNVISIFENNIIIQITGYEILVLFTENGTYAYGLANTDIFSIIRNTLLNQEFNNDPEKRLKLRLAIYKLLNYLAYDKSINLKISFELMESFVKDLMAQTFTEDLNEMTHLLVTLFKTKLPIEPFIQYSGLEALSFDLAKFSNQKTFILNCFSMIRAICFSSLENKDKLLDLDIQEKIKFVVVNSKPEEKKIKFEGKILMYNLNYDKKDKPKISYMPPLSLIEKEKMIKRVIYNFIVKGIAVKASNPRGKIKDFILAFSPDLMKIYLKKPKAGVIPPKTKYTLETPLVSEVIRNYEIINFKKGGLFNKPPEKQICFAILQSLLEGQKAPKKLSIICSSPIEAYQISGCVEIVIDYIKTKCNKQNICKIENMEEFFMSLMLNQPREKPGERKRTLLIRGKF